MYVRRGVVAVHFKDLDITLIGSGKLPVTTIPFNYITHTQNCLPQH